MARVASAVFALIIALPCASAHAGDLFSGFQMDHEEQYFAYFGVKQALPWEPLGIATYAQLFGAGQNYQYESGNRDIDADVQTLTPSLGVTRLLDGGPWNVSALAGPELKWKQEDGFRNDSGRDFDVGAFVQLETMYWQETHNLQAMVSYASLDDFFFGRVRGKFRIHAPETRCCTVFVGLDVAGMGNDDFSAVLTGPLVEVPVGRFSLLARAGYQHDSGFGSGGYGGFEIYTPF